jgi:hypothetical protein
MSISNGFIGALHPCEPDPHSSLYRHFRSLARKASHLTRGRDHEGDRPHTRRLLVAITIATIALATAGPLFHSMPTAAAATSYRYDIYDSRGVRWQNPDYTACTAASTEMMLNMIAYLGVKSAGVNGTTFRWTPNVTYATQEKILAFERAHMTMLVSSAGTDPHGWRNALNYYGWGSLLADVYRDTSFTSFDAAAKWAVRSVGSFGKPVAILGWAGGHAQFITGYSVTGADPKTGSTAFTINGVYLTDPLASDGWRNTYVSYSTWRSGVWKIRFSSYAWRDSPYRDPVDGHIGKSEWYGRWVIVNAVR